MGAGENATADDLERRTVIAARADGSSRSGGIIIIMIVVRIAHDDFDSDGG